MDLCGYVNSVYTHDIHEYGLPFSETNNKYTYYSIYTSNPK